MTSTVDLIVSRLKAAAPRAGQTKVLTIDGRSGSGKSTLARQIQEKLAAPMITMDYLYEGWNGLLRGMDLLVSEVLVPLAGGQTAKVPQYDWINETWSTPRELPPPAVLIVEGVGAGSRKASPYISVSVWLTAGESQRKERTFHRDSSDWWWDQWAEQEATMLESERTWERADLVISTENGFNA